MTSQGGLRGWTWTYMHVASMSDYEEHMLTWAFGFGTTRDFISYTWL